MEGIAAAYVIQYLENNGGIYGVYEKVKKKYPRRRNQAFDTNSAHDETSRSNHDTCHGSSLSINPSVNYRASAEDNGLYKDEYEFFEVVKVNARPKDLSRFLQLRKGEKLSAVVECVDWQDDWIVLKFSSIREYKIIVETVRR
jgi:hypothetical protein